VVSRTGGGVHLALELVDRMEGEVRGDFHQQQARREAPAAMGRKVRVKQRRVKGSLSHNSLDLTASPMTAASSLRYASLSAMNVDLGRMVVGGGCEANGFACA
jgi:hypothetical protein